MTGRVRPCSAGVNEQKSYAFQQHSRPSTASNHARLSRKSLSWDGFSPSVVRPTSALERTEMYKKLLVDSVHRIHCPTLYRALCKVEKKIHVNRKLRYAFAKMLYLAAVRGDYSYDDIQDHLRLAIDVFVSSPESRQLVLYAGIFSTNYQNNGKSVLEEIKTASDIEAATSAAAAAATAFQEDMRACVKGMPLSVPPLYCYNKWRKDVKKLESRRHLSSGFFAGAKKSCNARIAVMGSYESFDCGGSQASFEDVMAGDLDGLLRADSVVSGRIASGMKSLHSDDEDDDFSLHPAPKKVSKLSKFKKIAFGVMMALPSDEKDMQQNINKQRKNGLQYLYRSGTNPEQQRMIACLIRGELPTKDKPKVAGGLEGDLSVSTQLDDDAIAKVSPVGGVGIVATDDIAQGYFNGTRLPSPSTKPRGEMTSPSSRFSFSPTRRTRFSPMGSNYSEQESLESATKLNVQLDWDELGKTSVPTGVVVCPEERRIIVDSIPTSPKPQTKSKTGAASLRQVTIIESSAYAPPTPNPVKKVKVCATVGLAKLHLLRKSPSFMARQEQSATASCQMVGADTHGPEVSSDNYTTSPNSTIQESAAVEVSVSVCDSPKGTQSRSSSRGSPIRPTVASPHRSSSGSKLGGTGVDEDTMSPTLHVLNEFSVPFAG